MSRMNRLKLDKLNQLNLEKAYLDKAIKNENEYNDRAKDIFNNKVEKIKIKCRRLGNELAINNLTKIVVEDGLGIYLPSGATHREYTSLVNECNQLKKEVRAIKNKQDSITMQETMRIKTNKVLIQAHRIIKYNSMLNYLPRYSSNSFFTGPPITFSLQHLMDALQKSRLSNQRAAEKALASYRKPCTIAKEKYPKLPQTSSFSPYVYTDDDTETESDDDGDYYYYDDQF